MQFDMQVVWSVAAGLFVLALWLVAVAAWQWLRQSKQLQGVLAENEALNQLTKIVEQLVVSAAAQFKGESGATKREWVLAQLAKRFPQIDPDLARAFLEREYDMLRPYVDSVTKQKPLVEYKPDDERSKEDAVA